MERRSRGLGKRVFLMNNVHEDAPVLFETRFTLSFLRGPLTKKQIQVLMAPQKGAMAPAGAAGGLRFHDEHAPSRPVGREGGVRAVARRCDFRASGSSTGRRFWDREAALRRREGAGGHLGGCACLLAPVVDGDDLWDRAETISQTAPELEAEPDAKGRIRRPAGRGLPGEATRHGRRTSRRASTARRRSTSAAARRFACPPRRENRRATSRFASDRRRARPGTPRSPRCGRNTLSKLDVIAGQEQRAAGRVAREQAQVQQQTIQTAISVGATVLGALFGRKALIHRRRSGERPPRRAVFRAR